MAVSKRRPVSTARRDPLRWVIEAFSVASGLSFVASGAVNWITFYVAWGINYFLVASPADVVMSGFIVLTFAVIAVSVFALAIMAVWFIAKALRKAKITWAMMWVILREVGPAALVGMIFVAATIPLLQVIEARARREPAGVGAGRDPAGTGARAVPDGTGSGGEPDGGGPTGPSGGGGPTGPNGGGPFAPTGFSYGSGLRLDPGSAVIPQCRSAPVLWMGSQSVVLNCEGQVKVYHSLSGIITEQTRP